MSAFRTPRWPRAALSGMAAAALLSAVLPTAPPARAADRSGPPVPARYAHQRLNWQPCTAKPSLECAHMTVPRDWHHPGSEADLTVAVSGSAPDQPRISPDEPRIRPGLAPDQARRTRSSVLRSAGVPAMTSWTAPVIPARPGAL